MEFKFVLVAACSMFLLGCARSDEFERRAGGTRPFARRALEFAKCLAGGDFEGAHKMLSPELQSEYSAAGLKAKYDRMTAYVGAPSQATEIEVMNTMDEFPGKEGNDLGWAYVSIAGPHPQGGMWSEAVTVVVTERDGELLIRELVWGRP
jgi:hypothetical protein